jgi:hypothetical protein
LREANIHIRSNERDEHTVPLPIRLHMLSSYVQVESLSRIDYFLTPTSKKNIHCCWSWNGTGGGLDRAAAQLRPEPEGSLSRTFHRCYSGRRYAPREANMTFFPSIRYVLRAISFCL